MKRLFAICVASLMLTSCVNKVEHVDMSINRHVDKSTEVSTALKKLTANIKVASINDGRLEKQQLGKFPHTTIFGDNFSSWIHARFEEVENASSAGNSEAKTSVDVTVQKAYIRLLPSSLGASVVLDVNYTCATSTLTKHQLYRGDSTSLNWAFGHSEIMGVLNKSMTKLLVDMVQDIDMDCSGEMVSSE